MMGNLNDIVKKSNFLTYSMQFLLFEQNILYEKMIISLLCTFYSFIASLCAVRLLLRIQSAYVLQEDHMEINL